MSARDGLYSLASLRRLHAAPKNRVTLNHRFATPAQMEEFYAMHAAFPALAEAVEAARDLVDAMGIEMDDPRLEYVVAQVDREFFVRLSSALAAFERPDPPEGPGLGRLLDATGHKDG